MGSLQQLDLAAVTKEIADKEELIDPVIEYQYKTNKGDGYLGIINAIELKGKNKSLQLIVKSAPSSEKFREVAPIGQAFLTEINFYEKVIPILQNLQDKYKITNQFKNFPKCYATIATPLRELLILGNLKSDGYDLWDRKKAMNFEHVEYVFNEYGKFHALSYALREKESGVFKDLLKDNINVMALFMKTSDGLLKQRAGDLVTDFEPSDKIYAMYKAFADNVSDEYKSTHDVDEYAVITHGDCWCNNMMFKYENSSRVKPSSMRLLDFQLSMIGSPVLDLSYFYYVCASEDALNNLSHFQEVYYKSLSNTLKQFGCDATKVFPYTEFMNQWKKYAKFGLIMATIVVKLMMSDSDEAPDLSEYAEKAEADDLAGSFDFKSRNDDEYRRRVGLTIKHFCNNNLF